MRWNRPALAMLAAMLAAPAPTLVRAQAPADSASAAAAPDSAHRKGGLFGKVKKVASNKVVQSVTKVAACTVVPGGSAVAGAIDAAASKNASGAATGAAEAATGSACTNTMGRLANGGMDAAAEQALHPPVQPTAPTMDPQVQAQLNAMGFSTDEEAQAKCLGVSVEEYRLIVYPPGMNTRPPTKAEMKARHEAMKKLDPKKQQECSMQATSQVTNTVNAQAAEMQQRTAAADAGGVTESPGKTVRLATDLPKELASGKTAIMDIDWVAGTANLSAQGQAPFRDAMKQLGAALMQTPATYRLDLYIDKRYSDDAADAFGSQRLALVQQALAEAGVDAARLKIGKTKKDQNPRLEVVRTK
jgi:hypothetical protein